MSEQKQTPFIDSSDAWWQLPGITGWKDGQFIHQGVSKTSASLVGFDKAEDFIGITDGDIRCDAKNSAPLLKKIDTQTMQQGKSTTLEIGRYADGKIRAFLVEKNRIYDNTDAIIGLVYHAIEVTNIIMTQVSKALLTLDRQFYEKKGCISQIYTLSDTCFFEILTIREQECLFYLLRGKTAPQIAEILFRSKRTIETHIENIKNKLNCQNKQELIDYAISHGYIHHFPKSMINHLVE